MVYLQLFTPPNDGELALRQLADLFAKAMDLKTLAYPADGTDAGAVIRLYRSWLTSVGKRQGYHQMNCCVDYQHDRLGD
jgi:hypothetical protein